MKKTIFLSLIAALFCLVSCNKTNTATVIRVQYYLSGNISETVDAETVTTPVIYENDKEKYRFGQYFKVNSVSCAGEDLYLCGSYLNKEDGTTSPRYWKNDQIVNTDASALEGSFKQVICLNDGTYVIGTVKDGESGKLKGVMLKDGKTVFTADNDSKDVTFEVFTINYNNLPIIAGWIDGIMTVWTLVQNDEEYKQLRVLEYNDTVMNYSENLWEIKDIITYSDAIFLALNKTDLTTMKSCAVYTEGLVLHEMGKTNDESFATCITYYSGPVLAGSVKEKADSNLKASLWDPSWNDFSKGLEQQDSYVFEAVSDGLGTLHVIIAAKGKIQYQLLAYTGSQLMEMNVPENFTPSGLGMKFTRETITYEN